MDAAASINVRERLSAPCVFQDGDSEEARKAACKRYIGEGYEDR